MSLLRHLRLKSKSRSPDLKRKNSNTVVMGGINKLNEPKRKSAEITRSDTFTIKLQTPESDLPNFDDDDGDKHNYRTFTRNQGSRVQTDVFDALYTRGLIHNKRDSVSFRCDEDHNEYDEYVKSSKFDGGTYRKSKQGTSEPVKFDGGTYRKSSMKSIIRKDTFTKQDSTNKPTYIFGGEPKQRSNGNSESDENDNEKKVAEVMSWYVKLDDIKQPQIESRISKKENIVNVIHIPNDNYKPKPMPRSSIMKHQETFRMTSDPVQIEIQRKPSIKEPIRIEIRNPPLSKRDRDIYGVRPIGVAMPYNKNTLIESRKRPPFLAGVANTHREHYSVYNTPLNRNKQSSLLSSPPVPQHTSKEFIRINSFWNKKQNDKSNNYNETAMATSKPKKLQKFWSSINTRSKKHLDQNIRDDTDSINRYTYTSKAIIDLENQHNQTKTIPRKTNATSNTLSWLMKVKSKKNN